jgi:putative tricarboxylic transport membrane protein
MLIGVGFLLCGVALIVRSLRGQGYERDAEAPMIEENFGSSAVIIGAIVGYIALADRLGFLIVVPVCLVVVFRALRVNWRPSLAWAIGGTLLVHVAFYKLLRVPLPWGVFRPFY